MKSQVAREVWIVTAWHEDCVYKTKNTGQLAWLDLVHTVEEEQELCKRLADELRTEPKNILLCSVSNYDYNLHHRRVPNDQP